MSTIDKIEKELEQAFSIQFFPTQDYDKEPPVVVLTFSKQHGGASGYNLMLDNFKSKEITLVIFSNPDALDISLVHKPTGNAVNVKGLKYDNEQLRSFIASEPKDRRFVFAIGFISIDGLSITATREPFTPLLVDKYEVITK